MANILLCILAAVLVIFVAGLLVRWQNKQELASKELSDEITNAFGEAVVNYHSITGEDPKEETIECLEKDIKCFNDSLRQVMVVENDQPYERRKSRYVKRKKNFAND